MGKKEKSLFISDKEAIRIIRKENRELEQEVRKLKKEIKNLKKINIYCETCKKHIGFRIKGHYDILEGTIQKGQGKDKPLLSYCSRKCERYRKGKQKVMEEGE